MKIAIVGPGAMGCLFGAFLIKARQEVYFLDKNEERAKKISAQGIKVEGLSNFSVKAIAKAKAEEIGPCELVILCVKSYDTEKAIKHARGLISKDTSVLTLQNGINNLQTLNEIVGAEKVVGGVTSQGATLLGIGCIRHAGKGETVIGKADGKILGAVRDISNLFNKSGLETKISKDINSLIWSKLIINVGINALTAITRLNNGRLVEYDGTREILRSAVLEAVKVAKRKKIKLIYDDPVQKTEKVAEATKGNISSMLQDVLKEKRTEIDYINGAIVRQGRNLGIPTPVNSVLSDLVRTIEISYDKYISK